LLELDWIFFVSVLRATPDFKKKRALRVGTNIPSSMTTQRVISRYRL